MRASVLSSLLVLSAACTPAERILAPIAEHAQAPHHNLPAGEQSVYRWTDPGAWPDGAVPATGSDVVIPADRHVLLDSPAPLAMRRITILGTLEFLDDRDHALAARTIEVHGALIIGRRERRFTHRARLTMTGSAAENSVFGAGGKGIVVIGGTLELHGQPVTAWTRLGSHARAGDATLVLDRETGWRAGDRLAVSSTSFDPTESELVEVQSVAGKGVRLTRPLTHSHWGALQQIAGRTLDERAEVGLLTRNVVIEGDEGSAASGYGAQVMIHPGSVAHVEGVEFHRVGQRGALGRYPLHWHLARETEGHYARENAVWQSYNRCMTIHGTHGVTLERNVCYDHEGHGFFLEDGIEHGNVLAGNLGMRTRTPSPATRLLETDERPATFWVTNPDNDLHDNVAAGSDGFGIWYAMPTHPTGLSATTAIWPRHVPLARFENNTAHSNVQSGLWVDEGIDAQGRLDIAWYEPRMSDGENAPEPAIFRGLVAWKNQALGAWFRGSHLHLEGAVLADNMSGVSFGADHALLDNSFIVGVSENVGVNPRAWVPVRGFWFYDGPVGVRRTTFANFDARAGANASALGFNPVNPWPISAENWVDQVTFVDAVPMMFEAVVHGLDATKSALVVDRDGSLTGAANSVLVPDAPLLRGGCAQRASWRAWSCGSPFTQLTVRADRRIPDAIVVQRYGDVSTTVRVAPVRYDSSFATLTVPLDAALELRSPGDPPSTLIFTSSAMTASAMLDLSLPELRDVIEVMLARDRSGRTIRRVPWSESAGCVDCWSVRDGGVGARLRVRSEADAQELTVTVRRAAGSAMSDATPAEQAVRRGARD